MILAILLFSAFPLWICDFGADRVEGVILKLGGLLSTGVALLLLLPLVAEAEPYLSAYGAPLTEALRCAAWWCIYAAGAASVAAIAFYLIGVGRKYKDYVKAEHGTWAAAATGGLERAMVQTVGILCLALGTVWLLILPVRTPGVATFWTWMLPGGYLSSLCAALAFWALAGCFLWKVSTPTAVPTRGMMFARFARFIKDPRYAFPQRIS